MMRFTNLFIGYNQEEDFRILICAFDTIEAQELAEAYRFDAGLSSHFDIEEVEDGIDHLRFDCDYIIA